MSKINNLDFTALNLFGDNYLQWALDAKIILKSKGLGECITAVSYTHLTLPTKRIV